MIRSKILDENPDFKNFINELRENIITCGTGIGKYGLVYDKYCYKTEVTDEAVNTIISEGINECYIINKDNITGGIRTRLWKDKVFSVCLWLIYNDNKGKKGEPNNILDDLYNHKEIPCDKVTNIRLHNFIINEQTILLIRRAFPNLNIIDIDNSKILSNASFYVLNNIFINIKDSIIENMSVFNGTVKGSLYIKKSKVIKLTKQHLIFDFADITLDRTTINMPMFLINTDFPNLRKFEASKRRLPIMKNIDATFLTAPTLEEISFKAEVNNLEFLQRHLNLDSIKDLYLNAAKDPSFLKFFKRRLEAKINNLKNMEEKERKGINKLIAYLEENYGHIGEEGCNKLVPSGDFAFLYLIPSHKLRRFYEQIKVLYDPLDFNNWIYKSRSNNIDKIIKELLLVKSMPYQLRKEIGKTANSIIQIPKQGDFIDLLEEVKENNKRFDEYVNCLNESINYGGSKIQDIHGNIYGANIKDIISPTYSVLTRFSQEMKFEEEEKLARLIKEYVPTKNYTLSYLFKKLKHVLGSKASEMYDMQEKAVKNKCETLLDEICPKCGNPLIYKDGRFGLFKSCSNFPKCKYIKNELTGEICPDCGKPIIIRASRFGLYTTCQDFPNCKYKKPLSNELEAKLHRPEKGYYYISLLSFYIDNALEELYNYQDVINAFTASDYQKIKASLPKLYEDMEGSLLIVKDESIETFYREHNTYRYVKRKRYYGRKYDDDDEEDYNPDDLPF